MSQIRKWIPILEVPVVRPSADSAVAQLRTARDFIGKPVQAVRRVGIELLQRSHFADFRRYAYQRASVQAQLAHRFEHRNLWR